VVKRSKVDVDLGGALMAAAQSYPYLLDFILEQIQNSIDAGARMVHLVINLQRRTLQVSDNGQGVSLARFEKALQQVFLTMKKDGDLGRFGRGLLSPLGKCKRFTFTSCEHREGVYREWEFVTDDVSKMKHGDGIPFTVRDNLHFSASRRTSYKPSAGQHVFVPWRTRVYVHGITTDRQLSRLDLPSLKAGILERYGLVMAKRGVTVKVEFITAGGVPSLEEIKAKGFEGEPLPRMTYRQDDCGEVEFNLFIARKDLRRGERRGKILFGETKDSFRFNTATFWHSVDGLLDPEVATALRSGIFEGEIVGQNLELDPGRKKFKPGDALAGFCLSFEQWFKDVGAKYMEEVTTDTEELRRQQNGLTALQVIEGLLKLMGLDELKDAFRRGTIGVGHAEIRPVGKQGLTSLAIQGTSSKVQEGTGHEHQEPEFERPGHHPSTVAGPRGQERRVVKSSSTGIQFCYNTQGMDPYTFDHLTGVLTFNVSHRYWAECDISDARQTEYQEIVATLALAEFLLCEGQDISSLHRSMVEVLGFLVTRVVHGDRLRLHAKQRVKK
jgi:hypothetical protein